MMIGGDRPKLAFTKVMHENGRRGRQMGAPVKVEVHGFSSSYLQQLPSYFFTY